VLILPPGHAKAVLARPRLGARERWMITTVLGTVAAVLVVVVISIASSGHQTGKGCLDVTIPGPIGGEELYRCGAGARALCASIGRPQGFSGVPGQDIARACRELGLPVG
jgi:hypothetical protein